MKLVLKTMTLSLALLSLATPHVTQTRTWSEWFYETFNDVKAKQQLKNLNGTKQKLDELDPLLNNVKEKLNGPLRNTHDIINLKAEKHSLKQEIKQISAAHSAFTKNLESIRQSQASRYSFFNLPQKPTYLLIASLPLIAGILTDGYNKLRGHTEETTKDPLLYTKLGSLGSLAVGFYVLCIYADMQF